MNPMVKWAIMLIISIALFILVQFTLYGLEPYLIESHGVVWRRIDPFPMYSILTGVLCIICALRMAVIYLQRKPKQETEEPPAP